MIRPRPTVAHRHRRPVSPTERLYLAAGHARGAMALRILVEGDGVPAPDRLRAAVARAAEAVPGSRLARRGPLWHADGPLPRVRYADARSAAAFEVSTAETTALLYGPARRTDPPGCEVLVVPGRATASAADGAAAPGTRTSLVFSVSHALMDGHGALIWVREVFRALRGDPARPALAADTDRGLLRRLGAGDRRPTLPPDLPSPLGRPAAGPSRTLWLRRTLPGHHPALTARLAQAVTDTSGRPGRVMVPVDLRRHRPGVTATGNLTLPLFLDLNPGDDWTGPHLTLLRALADGRELASGFESALAPLPLAASALLLRAGQAAADHADRHLASAVVSHLGRLALEDYSGGDFTATTAYALPVHAPLVPVSLVAAETPAGTELTMGVRGGPDLAARAERFLDRTLARLAPTPEPSPPPRFPPPMGPIPSGPTPPRLRPSRPTPPTTGTTVVDLLRAQAARTPHAVALDGPEGEVTYAELDRRSDAVARELAGRGVVRADLVGLIVDRTPAGVAALWGILKAGAAYVPLDPAHPGERIKEVLQECGARLCLTQRRLADALTVSVPCPLILIEDVLDAPGTTGGALPPAPGPGDLAYVMHTSGSSGRPKGVRIEHGGLTGFVRWMAEVCRVDEDTRFGFVSSYAFDISCFALFLPPAAGATTVLAPQTPSRATLRRLVHDHRADTLALTPSHLALFGGQGAVRTLLLGGEPLTPAAVRAARAAFGPDCRVVNGYGPTEATVACLAHVVDGGESTATIPLGTAGPDTRVDLLTEDGRLIGTGEEDHGRTGEIVVSGLQVARGYLGPPDGTSSPFGTRPDGVRVYRTGDLGRRLPGGAIEFAGRADGRLKIAGHRVEPAEIVAALEAHPAVSRAVVAARSRPGTTTPVLCAYVVPAASGDPAASGAGVASEAGMAPGDPAAPEAPAASGAGMAPGGAAAAEARVAREVSGASEARGTREVPAVSGTRATPGASAVSGAGVAREDPAPSGARVTPGGPAVSGAGVAGEVPAVSGAGVAGEVPAVSGARVAREARVAFGAGEASVASGAGAARVGPAASEARATPGAPAVSEARMAREVPVAVGARAIPAVPAVSGARVTPGAPAPSGARVAPGAPAPSGARVAPGAPAASGARVTPAVPAASEAPGAPVVAEVPGGTGAQGGTEVPGVDAPDLAAVLRAELVRRLPAHLVPARITTVTDIPRTVGGKADFDALPDPFGAGGPQAAPVTEGPSTLQDRVARHWAGILGVDAGILTADSEYQLLGGDSLALVEMLDAVSSDLLTEAQGRRFMSRLESLVRDVTLHHVCAHVEAARKEVPA
ncbi:amino acid adenylation domain-containing protein [Streptomyces sp. NPDC102278]|uniref:non-ribosomal peptide synthetase n=1 Tax=Streptomyces sp. NPDC102278 TaxID=3366152 RepID=UPI003801C53F